MQLARFRELAQSKGGEHGERLRKRNHFRPVYATKEACTERDFEELEVVKGELAVRGKSK
jgi:hypothetical protein